MGWRIEGDHRKRSEAATRNSERGERGREADRNKPGRQVGSGRDEIAEGRGARKRQD